MTISHLIKILQEIEKLQKHVEFTVNVQGYTIENIIVQGEYNIVSLELGPEVVIIDSADEWKDY